MSSNAHEVLGVDPWATRDEVTAAYRRLAGKFHPDAHPGATPAERASWDAAMKRLNGAYNELKGELPGRDTPRPADQPPPPPPTAQTASATAAPPRRTRRLGSRPWRLRTAWLGLGIAAAAAIFLMTADGISHSRLAEVTPVAWQQFYASWPRALDPLAWQQVVRNIAAAACAAIATLGTCIAVAAEQRGQATAVGRAGLIACALLGACIGGALLPWLVLGIGYAVLGLVYAVVALIMLGLIVLWEVSRYRSKKR